MGYQPNLMHYRTIWLKGTEIFDENRQNSQYESDLDPDTVQHEGGLFSTRS